ncbi:MAG: DUF3800 domain-containing protein [Candidatus Dadabacteria bacterium]|nr:DUF3800 domain-containing protein [Candidatus Dadabacteria bacterium]
MSVTPPKTCYMFVDESGNFDFSSAGTRFFVLTCVTTNRPFPFSGKLDNYKYDLTEDGYPLEKFHCAVDNAYIRSKVLKIIKGNPGNVRIDSVVVEKSKTREYLRESNLFYPRMLMYLLSNVLKGVQPDKAVVVTDSLPISSKRKAAERAIKTLLIPVLPSKYQILHHSSNSHYGLQVADYCCWSIFRKWERREDDYYSSIKPLISSELDIFQTGSEGYY